MCSRQMGQCKKFPVTKWLCACRGKTQDGDGTTRQMVLCTKSTVTKQPCACQGKTQDGDGTTRRDSSTRWTVEGGVFIIWLLMWVFMLFDCWGGCFHCLTADGGVSVVWLLMCFFCVFLSDCWRFCFVFLDCLWGCFCCLIVDGVGVGVGLLPDCWRGCLFFLVDGGVSIVWLLMGVICYLTVDGGVLLSDCWWGCFVIGLLMGVFCCLTVDGGVFNVRTVDWLIDWWSLI